MRTHRPDVQELFLRIHSAPFQSATDAPVLVEHDASRRQLKLSTHTVRNQLKAILRKAGRRTQSVLVRLILRGGDADCFMSLKEKEGCIGAPSTWTR